MNILDAHHDFSFFASYRFAGKVRGAIFEDDSYFPTESDEFLEQALKPMKRTILHCYIDKVIDSEVYFDLSDATFNDNCGDYVIKMLQAYSVKFKSFSAYHKETGFDIFEYNSDYLQEVAKNKLYPIITKEVFTLLFSDRAAMCMLNKRVASEVFTWKEIDFKGFLKRDGVVKRCDYWPSWLKKALFCREKGLCAICKRDLTSLHHTTAKLAIDHIVPLNLGGINDPTNLQLLCESCNSEKSGDKIRVTNTMPIYW
jgi:hypothetical protein